MRSIYDIKLKNNSDVSIRVTATCEFDALFIAYTYLKTQNDIFNIDDYQIDLVRIPSVSYYNSCWDYSKVEQLKKKEISKLIVKEWNSHYKEDNDIDGLHDYCVDMFNICYEDDELKNIINNTLMDNLIGEV